MITLPTPLQDYANTLHETSVLRLLPAAHVEAALAQAQVIRAASGTEMVREGDPAGDYYILLSGRADVFRAGIYDDAPQKVAELGAGDGFGCEALISGGTRNGTVRLTQDSVLLSFSRETFAKHINSPYLQALPASVTKAMIEAGWTLLDVRYPEEYELHRLPGATLLPLHELRSRMGELDNSKRYVVYCHSGCRSAVAAFLLAQNGISAVSIEGGIRDWPYAVEEDALEAA